MSFIYLLFNLNFRMQFMMHFWCFSFDLNTVIFKCQLNKIIKYNYQNEMFIFYM